jgi:hypothetical protein
MKISLALFAVLSFTSCQYNDVTKSPDKNPTVNEITFIGKWNWTATSGGFHPDLTPATEGYTMTLILTKDSLFTMFKNSATTRTGSYHTTKHGGFSYMLFDTDPGLLITQNSADALALGDDTADGPKYHYERIKN